MDRLTERTHDGILVKEDYEKEALKTLYQCYGAEPMPHYANCDDGYCAMEKLAEYEDLEEQGKLLKLPCKIGDTVYTACSWGIETGVVGSIEIISDRIFVNNIGGQMIGEASNVFLTRTEAERALAEMEGKK